MPAVPVSVRPVVPADSDWVRSMLEDTWGSVVAARKGELVDASSLAGFVAEADGDRVGLTMVAARGDEYEVVSISTTMEGRGVGRALLQRCVDDARSRGCRRVWLTTTNDNMRALAFYQQFGMDLCGFQRNAVQAARELKPSISLRGALGIPIAHELELELVLDGR